MRGVVSLFRRFLYIALVIFLVSLVGSASFIYYIIQDLPSHDHLKHYEPPMGTRIYSSDGLLFAEYAQERRTFVSIEEIPKRLIQAFLAVEDKSFYSHKGVDLSSIIRAAITNAHAFFSRSSQRPVGGSTITQQVAKNFLLTKERTYIRKIREAILAMRLESALSKDRILELYINEIYMGARTYGIVSASLLYFDKCIEDLELHEIAFLAALPKAPQNYHPTRHPESALERRNWVITRMLEEGFITESEAIHALQQPLNARTKPSLLTIDAYYFAEHVRQQLIERYNANDFYAGGLYVRSSLDSELQELADRVLHEGIQKHDKSLGFRGPITRITLENWQKKLSEMPLPKRLYKQAIAVVLELNDESVSIGFANGEKGTIDLQSMHWARKYRINSTTGYPTLGPPILMPSDVLSLGDIIVVSREEGGEYALDQIPEVNGGLVAIEPHSGRVVAFDGGYRFSHSQFNRITQAERQIGSTFKPFVYLSALEAGYTPASVLLDAPIVIGNWRPQNITGKFYGKNTLRRALERSVNLAPIRLASHIGMSRISELAKRLNIYDNMSRNLVSVLGSESTTLLRITTAYAMIANGGKYITPTFIDRVQDRHGNTLIAHNPMSAQAQKNEPWNHQVAPTLQDNRHRVIKATHAYQMSSMLEGVVSRGSGRRAHIPNVSIAGKTGTSSDFKDALFIGYTNQIVVGVFIGFDQPQSLGQDRTGGRVAGPIFKEFMHGYMKKRKAGPFPTPEGISLLKVDLETGKPMKSDQTILEAFEKENDNHTSLDLEAPLGDNTDEGLY